MSVPEIALVAVAVYDVGFWLADSSTDTEGRRVEKSPSQ